MVSHEARRVVCRECEAGELRELWVEPTDGAVIVGEDTEGVLTQAVFGEAWHRTMVRVGGEAFYGIFGGAGVEAFLASSDAPLCDLMDLLDKACVSYEYLGLGSGGVGTLRRRETREMPHKMDFSQTLDVRARA